jgi:hypothetical protein
MLSTAIDIESFAEKVTRLHADKSVSQHFDSNGGVAREGSAD